MYENLNSPGVLLKEIMPGIMSEIEGKKKLPLNYDYLERNMGFSFLSYCVLEHKTKELRLLLEAGANPNKKSQSRQEFTCFFDAIRLGHLDCVETLLDFGVDLHQTDKQGRKAIWWTKSPEVLQFLHNKGFDLNQFDQQNNTILTKLICAQHSTDGKTADDKRICELLDLEIVDVNVKVLYQNYRQSYYRTPLMLSIVHMRGEVVKKLLEKGADIDYLSEDGYTALSFAKEMAEKSMIGAQEIFDYLQAWIEKNKLESNLTIHELGLDRDDTQKAKAIKV